MHVRCTVTSTFSNQPIRNISQVTYVPPYAMTYRHTFLLMNIEHSDWCRVGELYWLLKDLEGRGALNYLSFPNPWHSIYKRRLDFSSLLIHTPLLIYDDVSQLNYRCIWEVSAWQSLMYLAVLSDRRQWGGTAASKPEPWKAMNRERLSTVFLGRKRNLLFCCVYSILYIDNYLQVNVKKTWWLIGNGVRLLFPQFMSMVNKW